MAKYCIQVTQRLLQQKAKNVDALDHVISKHQEEIKKQLETSSLSNSSVANSNQRHQPIEVTSDSNDDDDMPPARPTRGRGRWVTIVTHHNIIVVIVTCYCCRGRGAKRTMDSVRFDWL